MITKLRKKLNHWIAKNLFERNKFFLLAANPGKTLIYGYAPIYSVLCRCVVDIGRHDGIILAMPVPWWQYTFLKTEQTVFFIVSRKEEKVFKNTPNGQMQAVMVTETGIWFEA